MMNCLEFRRAAGADPSHLSSEASAHRDDCPQCAAHLRQLLAMDARILEALRVPASSAGVEPRPSKVVPSAVVKAALGDRSRWYALAASIVSGVLVGVVLWTSGPRDALAKDVLAHLAHEPGALAVTEVPVDAERVRAVLAKDGVRLRSDVGLVSYVQSCPFRGHVVPHLVVQTAGGPVTVLVLRDEQVRRAMKFHEGKFVGTIEPDGPGSIAVIAGSPEQVREAAARVMAALEWTTR